MTARRPSDTFAPSSRPGGPPGIDWTQAAPECPACWRVWLAGDLPTGPLLSRRTHAALAAAALALSSTAPAAVLAAEPHHHRGHAGLHDSDPGDPGAGLPDPGDSPGAPATPEPEPPDADPDAPDSGTSPAPEPVPGPTEPDDPVEAESGPAAPTPDEEAPAPETPVTSPEGGSPPPAATADPPSASTAAPVTAVAPEQPQTQRHVLYKPRSAPSHRSSRLSSPGGITSSPAPQAVPRSVVPAPRSVLATAGRAGPGDRTHIVRPGESLWSIATNYLGDDASAARIAHEVKRLWELNRAHIGSGDPDVLMAGTQLRLR